MIALARLLRVALVVAFVAAVLGAVLPGRAGTVAAVVGLVVLIGTPVLRVGWLTVAWSREGDRRFAVLGLVLLGVLGVGGVAALL